MATITLEITKTEYDYADGKGDFVECNFCYANSRAQTVNRYEFKGWDRDACTEHEKAAIADVLREVYRY